MSKLWAFGDSFTAGHGCKYELNGTFSTQNIDNYYFKTYKDYIDINKKIWPELVSDYFGYELCNMGRNGMSTESIADNVLKYFNEIDKNDIVIIQPSTIGRYDFPFLKEKTLMGNYNAKNYKRDTDLFNTDSSPYFFKTIFLTNIEKEYSNDLQNVLQYTNVQESLNDKSVLLNKEKYNTIRNFFVEFISTGKFYERAVWRILQISKILESIGVNVFIINEDRWPDSLLKPNNLMYMHDGGMTGYMVTNKKTIYHKTNTLIEDYHPSYEGHADIANFIINFINNENTDIHNS